MNFGRIPTDYRRTNVWSPDHRLHLRGTDFCHSEITLLMLERWWSFFFLEIGYITVILAKRSGDLQIQNFMQPSARLLIYATWPPEAHEFNTPGVEDLFFHTKYRLFTTFTHSRRPFSCVLNTIKLRVFVYFIQINAGDLLYINVCICEWTVETSTSCTLHIPALSKTRILE